MNFQTPRVWGEVILQKAIKPLRAFQTLRVWGEGPTASRSTTARSFQTPRVWGEVGGLIATSLLT